MYGVVYKITNTVNGKPYIGQTTQTLNRRVGQHKRADSLIGKAIRKYGWENFTVEILEECETPEQLNECEKLQIAHHNSKAPNGYNRTDGGDGACGCVNSAETRAKKSASHKGKKLSAEHCANIAAGNRGKKRPPRSPEAIAKTAAANSGKKRKPFTAEHRAKIGAAHRGRPLTPEHRRKIGESGKGKPSSFLGKHHTDESKSKSSASQRGYSPFKNLLKELDKHHLSYTSLAKLMGVSFSSVSLKMLGKFHFTAKDIAKLVEIFGMPAEYLMARDD